jgi:asparagine synthase (glutamine-hydrolysing)
MCGIAGVVGKPVGERQASDAVGGVAAVTAMLHQLEHRGPDEYGVLASPGVVLGSRRLAIIDVAHSHQPLWSRDRQHALAFNGEILNFRELRRHPAVADWSWRTQGDTEVLLALLARLGAGALPLFNGQFAGAFWDARSRRLLLFRDRIGIVPLHYAPLPDTVAFASTVGALLALRDVDGSMDPQGLRQLFTFWAPHPPHTICRGVYQLPGGCCAVVEDGKLTVSRYWEATFTHSLAERDGAEKAERLRAALGRATARALRADQEVGTLVSGGIDSAVLCALSTFEHIDRPSFSMTFEDALHDESRFQQLVVRTCRTRHTTVPCPLDAIAAALPAAVANAGTPFLRFSPAAASLMSAAIRQAGVKTVVSGEGADELFYGYDLFKEVALRRGEVSAGAVARSGVGGTPAEHLPPHVLAIMLAGDGDDRFLAHAMRWNAARQAGMFVRPEIFDDSTDPVEALFAELPDQYLALSPQARAQIVELRTLLPDYILSTQGDRMLMANSVEGRFPFLDNEVIDLSLAIADDDKLRGGVEKHLVKQAAAGLVPAAIIDRRKQAYRAPVGAVLRSASGAELAAAALAPSAVHAHGIFEPRKVAWLARRLALGAPLSNTQDMALAAVVTTQLWLDTVTAQRKTMEDIAA